jgi:hypothetical protein
MNADNGFIGSWRLTLQPDAGTASHRAFASFMANGVLMTSPPPVEEFPLAPEGVVYVSSGHGVWESTDSRSASLTFGAQAMNGQGGLIGLGTVSATLELGADGQEIIGRYAFEMAGPDETVFATEQGTVQFKRIVMQEAPVSGRAAA